MPENQEIRAQDPELAGTLISAMEAMVKEFDYVDLASSLVSSTIDVVNASAAGVMVSDAAHVLHVVAASHESMRTLELFEIQADEGPCLDCWNSGRQVVSLDLREDDRWPIFGPRAIESGYVAALATPLRVRDQCFGALNILWANPTDLDDSAEQAARALADLAAIGLINRALPMEATFLAEQIQTTINARVTIEQAKGMLAEQAQVDMNAAYSLMRDFSRVSGTHLLETARGIIDRRISAAHMTSTLSHGHPGR